MRLPKNGPMASTCLINRIITPYPGYSQREWPVVSLRLDEKESGYSLVLGVFVQVLGCLLSIFSTKALE